MMAPMKWGPGGTGDVPTPVRGSVGEMLLAAVVFAVAMGITWLSYGRDGGGWEALVGLPRGPSAGNEGDVDPSELPALQPVGPDGVVGQSPPETTRIIDPETGEEVVVTLPPTTAGDPTASTTVPTGSGSTAPPGTSPTTSPSSTTTSTTEPSTTTSTTEPTTTSTESTTTTTTTPADPPG